MFQKHYATAGKWNIRRKLRTWSYLLKKLMENFIFCAMLKWTYNSYLVRNTSEAVAQMFFAKVNLRNFTKLPEIPLQKSLILKKLQASLQLLKRTPTRVFCCGIFKNFSKQLFIEYL